MAEPRDDEEVTPADPRQSVETAILEAVRSLRYGSVEVVVHDSRVVQIECKKKIRFQPGG